MSVTRSGTTRCVCCASCSSTTWTTCCATTTSSGPTGRYPLPGTPPPLAETSWKHSTCHLTVSGVGGSRKYHKLPQVSPLLSRQKYACHDKHFVTRNKFCVATNVLFQHNFVVRKVLSRQAYFCHDKYVFVATNICHSKKNCHDKHNFVARKALSWQACFCCDKRSVGRLGGGGGGVGRERDFSRHTASGGVLLLGSDCCSVAILKVKVTGSSWGLAWSA